MATSRTSKPSQRSARTANDGAPPAETHQTVNDAPSRSTTQLGVPVADDQNSLTAGDRGPQLLEDFVMREKIFHFDHERIPIGSSMGAGTASGATSRTTTA